MKCLGCGMRGVARDCCEDRPPYCDHCDFIHRGLEHDGEIRHDSMERIQFVDGWRDLIEVVANESGLRRFVRWLARKLR